MKQILVIACVFISTLNFAQEETSQLNWLTNLDEAKTVAKAEKKPILLYFTGSDWCTPCVALKRDFFETEEFLERSKELVLVMIDYPRRTDIISAEQKKYNKGIIDAYNKNKSFPKLLMLNTKGKEIGKLSGYSSFNTYQDTSHHYAFVDKYIGTHN